MNYADLESAWRSPHNQPDNAAMERMKAALHEDLRRRRRSQTTFLLLALSWMTVITAAFVRFLIWPDADEQFDLTREWAALVMLALPWVGLGVWIQRHFRHAAAHPLVSGSVRNNLAALLDENRLQIVRLKTVSWLHAAIMVILPLIVWQLREVGKAGDEILLPAFVFWPAIALGILAALRWRYTRKLLPRQRELEALLGQYAG